MATKKTVNTKEDARKGRSRYVDQPGQWTDRTPASVKKKQQKEWAKLEESLKKGKGKKK